MMDPGFGLQIVECPVPERSSKSQQTLLAALERPAPAEALIEAWATLQVWEQVIPVAI
jgi:hypothetical protein